MRVQLGWTEPSDAAQALVQRSLRWETPALPGLAEVSIRRWRGLSTWMPPETVSLCRHRAVDAPRWLVSNSRTPPAGYLLEWDLGCIHRHAAPGTGRLVGDDGGFRVEDERKPAAAHTISLGFVEHAPLPMLDALLVHRVPATGQLVLVAGAEDPLAATTETVEHLGWIESFPIQPRRVAPPEGLWGVRRLLRVADTARWRHAYAADSPPHADGVVALGTLLDRPAAGFAELRLEPDGLVSRAGVDLGCARRDPVRALRWASAPLRWPVAHRRWTARAAASRLRYLAASARNGSVHYGAGEILGWLRAAPAPGFSPLFDARHPALGDQFLTRSELEALDLGYRVRGVIGYIGDAGADRQTHQQPHEILWGSRFGRDRRYVEGRVSTP